jgi:molybdopterin/thiamine biosynthesis adenylyltransferase
MDDLYKEIFSRNIGFLLDADQEKLRRSTVGVAGVGGVGGLLAERLLRLGIGHLKITDPGDFEHSNINRQFCSSMNTLGVIYSQLRDINPMAVIDWSSKGIVTQEDADLFVSGCDVIVDEMDFGLFKEAIYLQRAARTSGLYYMFVSAIGFGSLSVIFDPGGLTLEEYNNLDQDIDISNFVDINVPLERICPVIPSYALSVPTEIVEEILTADANEVANILLEKRDVTCAPKYTYIDLVDRQFIVGTVL